MNRKTLWTWGRYGGSVLVLAVLIWRVGTGPFIDGVREVDGQVLAQAAAIAALSTVCCAWRWKVVASGLGVDLSLPAAVAAYYRSQFLNVTLPGGVAGDVHRGIRHGRDVRDVGRGLRAVAWERSAGQLVQGILTVVVLLALPSPVHSAMPLVAIGAAVSLLVVVLVGRALTGGDGSMLARVRSTAGRDIRDALLTRKAWPAIALASTVVVAGHAVTFMIAARAAGTTGPPSQMLPVALIAMMGMVLPSAAGWGPREGVTAWAFGAAGLGAQRGVATAVVYGLMVLVACLPGAAVLLVAWFRGIRVPERGRRPLRDQAAHA